MKHPIFKATALSLALGLLDPLPAVAQSATSAEVLRQLDALSRRVQELERQQGNAGVADVDQKVRILERKLELSEESSQKALADAKKAQDDAAKRAKLLPTVYGKLNVSVEQRDWEGAGQGVRSNAINAGHDVDQWHVSSNASRLGVKGEIPISDNLSAVYQAEYDIYADSGSTTFASRNIYGGLKSKTLGTVLLGRIDTPLKSAEGRVDQFNDLKGDIDELIGGQERPDNAIFYSSPKLADLVTINVAAYQAEGSDWDYDGHVDDDIGDAYSVSAVLQKGIFYGAVAYDNGILARRSVDGFAKQRVVEAYRIVGGLRSGIWEAGFLAQVSRDGQHSDRKDESYLLSGAVNVTEKLKLKAQYGISEGEVFDEKGTLWAVGADYNFTSRIRAYTYWSTLELKNADVRDDTLGVGLDISF